MSEVIGKTATQTVARLLREYAQRTSLRGVNPYRAKAHFTAADSLAALSQPLDRIIPSGTLTEIPGIGYAIADIITKLHQTGSHPSLQKLRKDVPEGVLELFAIPGIRPDKILKLHQELGISSLTELEEAAKQDRIRKVKGLGASMQFDSTQRRNTAPSAQGRGSTSTGAGTRRRSITAASSVLIPTRTPSGSWTICTGASKWPVKAACPRTASSMPCPSLNSCVICSAGGKPRAMRPSVRKSPGKQSAGLLLYRRKGDKLEVLLGQPGGPFGRNKDLGSSSIPKGLIADGESPLAAPKGGWRGSSPALRIARRPPAEAYIVMRTPFALTPFTLEGAKTCSVAVSIKQPHWMNARKSRPSAYEKKLRASRPSIERDIVIRKARHAETGARIQDWLKSTGLHPPE